MQNSQAIKTAVALKSLGEKSCEIKISGQEMATNILRLIIYLRMLHFLGPLNTLPCALISVKNI